MALSEFGQVWETIVDIGGSIFIEDFVYNGCKMYYKV